MKTFIKSAVLATCLAVVLIITTGATQNSSKGESAGQAPEIGMDALSALQECFTTVAENTVNGVVSVKVMPLRGNRMVMATEDTGISLATHSLNTFSGTPAADAISQEPNRQSQKRGR